ncbi:MAG: hypothetical protein ABJ327_22970 [Litoreibacter sp.]
MNSLKFVMRLNATSCVSFGLLFILMPQTVALFLGQAPAAVITALGIGLMGNGAHLIAASWHAKIRETEVIWFSLGDFSWWLVTLALIVADLWITTSRGIVTATIVASGVACLGVAQLWILGHQRHGNTNGEHINAIARSWMALPSWVKVWLAVLNSAFVAAFVFLPDRIAEVTLIAYFAALPLLAGQVGYDGGLRRILALGHLVPWIPFLIWLVTLPDRTTYVALLTIIVAICLAFDANDLRLFAKGERAIVGKDSSEKT